MMEAYSSSPVTKQSLLTLFIDIGFSKKESTEAKHTSL